MCNPGIFISHGRKQTEETENALNQEVLRTCSGLMGPRTPSLDVQDKSEGPELGLEELTGRQAQPHPRAMVGEGEGPHGVGR